MSDVKLQIQVNADTSNAKAALAELSQATSAIGQSSGNPFASLDLSGVLEAIRQLTDAVSQCTASMKNMSGQGSEASEQVISTVSQCTDSLEEMSDQGSEAGAQLEDAGDKGKRAMEKVGDGAAKSASSVKSLSSATLAMATAVGTALGNMLSSIASSAASFAKFGVSQVLQLGASQEQYRMKYQTLLGDMGKGNALFKQLANFANVTPFTSDDVIKAGQQLLSFGVSAGDVQKTLEAVGNAASATGSSAAEMAAIYGKAIVKGKVETESLNQMMERGIPIVRSLAKQMKVAESDIYKMASSGKISSKDLKAAFFAMGESGGVFAGMMSRQAESMSGKWSTVMGKIQQLAASFGEQLAPAVAVVLDYVINLIDAIAPGIESGQLMTEILSGIADIVPSVTDSFVTMYEVVVWTSAVLKGIWNIIVGIGKLVTGLIGQIVSGLLLVVEGVVRSFVGYINAVLRMIGKKGIEIKSDFGGMFNEDKIQKWSTDTMVSGIGDMSTKNVEVFAKAWQKTDRAENARDSVKETVSGMVGKMTDAIAGNIRKMNTTDSNLEGSTTPQTVQSAVNADGGISRSVDSLAKIGLYNFGAMAADGLDRRRNTLLESIRDGIQALRTGTNGKPMEIAAV